MNPVLPLVERPLDVQCKNNRYDVKAIRDIRDWLLKFSLGRLMKSLCVINQYIVLLPFSALCTGTLAYKSSPVPN